MLVFFTEFNQVLVITNNLIFLGYNQNGLVVYAINLIEFK
jgi:hypothetical protein